MKDVFDFIEQNDGEHNHFIGSWQEIERKPSRFKHQRIQVLTPAEYVANCRRSKD